jgi:hypothetical protein
MPLKLEYINDCLVNIYFSENNKYIGDFVMLEDGYFYYQPVHHSGVFSEYHLKIIYDRLTELNKDWNEKIKKELSE